ncbi:hypothetical protein [Acidaminococcus fermentans]|uniref:hypothetical protein n=1 Tax=Acidaminococcus fermentans TaxID=905 RepID=UPI002432B528|nr:hypothetical protein [Acidaminococcus fermentans]
MKIWKIVTGVLVFSQISLGMALAAAPSLDKIVKPSKGYVWRLDAANKLRLPRSWRVDDANRMSGSGQPSILNMAALTQELQKQGIQPKQVILVDLRQEDHGYLNGTAVSWYGENNWANVGKSDAAIRKEEARRLEKEENRETPYYHLDKKKKPHYKGTEKVQAALTEQQAAALFGLGYARFASTDHTWPEPAEVDAFLQWQKNLPADAWLHFHCQAGKGRTTAYMIMRDIWLNGQQDSLETICARQHALGGQDVLHMTHKEGWRQTIDDQKIYRLKQFYTYVKELQQGKITQSWTDYLKENP